MIIYHNQPNNRRHYINTRYENGCNGALSLIMGYNKYGITKTTILIKTFWHLLFVSIPFMILISLFVNLYLSSVLLLVYFLLFLLRYFIQGHLYGPIKYLYNSSFNPKFKDYIILTFSYCRRVLERRYWVYESHIIYKKTTSKIKFKELNFHCYYLGERTAMPGVIKEFLKEIDIAE